MELTPIIIVPTIMYFVYKIFEALIRRKERMMLVEKIEMLQPHSLQSYDYLPNRRFSALRFGLLLVGIGLGLITAWVLSLSVLNVVASHKQSLGNEFYRFRDMYGVIYLAAPAFFGGIGLFISYLLEKRADKS